MSAFPGAEVPFGWGIGLLPPGVVSCTVSIVLECGRGHRWEAALVFGDGGTVLRNPKALMCSCGLEGSIRMDGR